MFISPKVVLAIPPGLETRPSRVQTTSVNIFVKNTKFQFILAKNQCKWKLLNFISLSESFN